MTRERILSATAQALDDDLAAVPSIRPRRLAEYIGQRDLVEKLSIALQAAKERGEAMEHVLLHGPPGLGKTTLAHVIAEEMGASAFVTSGPALSKGGDLVGTLTKLRPRDVLFIDEIHRLPPAVEEYIYPAMEDCRIDFTVDSGMHAKVITIPIEPFTLIGATTRAGALTAPLRSRFGITHNLRFYEIDDLHEILVRAARVLGLEDVADQALQAIAGRSRGTPRIAIRLLRRARDYAQVRGEGRVDVPVIESALALEQIDSLGLDALDRAYLDTIGRVYGGGPVGLEAIAATLGEDAGTLEDVVEPYLLRVEFLARTRQGRRLTAAGAEHVGITIESTDSGLFN